MPSCCTQCGAPTTTPEGKNVEQHFAPCGAMCALGAVNGLLEAPKPEERHSAPLMGHDPYDIHLGSCPRGCFASKLTSATH